MEDRRVVGKKTNSKKHSETKTALMAFLEDFTMDLNETKKKLNHDLGENRVKYN